MICSISNKRGNEIISPNVIAGLVLFSCTIHISYHANRPVNAFFADIASVTEGGDLSKLPSELESACVG